MATGIACLIGVVALWSFVPVLIKQLLPVFDPLTIAFLRLAQGAAVVLALFLWGGRRRNALRLSGWHLLGGVGIGLNYGFYALSLSYTLASAGALIVQVQYVTLAVLAAVFLGERLSRGRVLGILLVLAGIAAIVGTRSDIGHLLAPRYTFGNVLMLFSGIGWGLYGLANKALVGRAGTAASLLPMMAVGAALTAVPAAWRFELHAPPGPESALMVVALGALATGGSYILVSEGMKRLSAALVGSSTALAPVGQIAMAHLFLDERLSWSLAAGGATVLAGILCMLYAERRPPPRGA